MKMNFGISTVNLNDIPQVIHGLSANTLFYLIYFEEKFKDKAYDGGINNMTHPSLPYDLDDFSRIMGAYQIFNWTADDIEKARKNAKKLKFGKKFDLFFENFMVLKSFYDDGEEGDEDFKELLDEIHYGKQSQNNVYSDIKIGEFQ